MRATVQTTVTAADIKNSPMVQRLIAKGAPAQSRKPRAKKAPAVKAVDAKAVVLAALRAATARAPQGDMLHVRVVRASCPDLDKVSFDRAAVELQAEEVVCLYHYDLVGWLKDDAAALAELVRGASGVHYNGITLR